MGTGYTPKTYRENGGDRHVIASGGSLDVESGGEIDIESGGALKLAGTALTATAAELNAMADGEAPEGYQVIRRRHTAAAIAAGTAEAVPAIAGRSFVCKDIFMRAIGGAVSGPTTVEVVIETTGTVMESHVTADLTENTWRGTADGTVVITGITAGGLVTAGKKLLVTDTGGTAFATATHLDTICVGYYTTT